MFLSPEGRGPACQKGSGGSADRDLHENAHKNRSFPPFFQKESGGTEKPLCPRSFPAPPKEEPPCGKNMDGPLLQVRPLSSPLTTFA